MKKSQTTTSLEVKELRREVDLLRSAIISLIANDTEGRYKPSFVSSVLKTASEKPRYKFTSADTLLSQLKKA